MKQSAVAVMVAIGLASAAAFGQTAAQPRVLPGPQEPDWVAILEGMYGLRMFDDLANPVRTTAQAVPGLFRKAGPGPVKYTPVIALGMPTVTRGGWYAPGPDDRSPARHELWSYQFRNTGHDLETGSNLPPPLKTGSAGFDPGDKPFGLWISNDNFQDGGVYTQPRLVAAINQRLAKQPYKAMIYPYKDKATGKTVPHSYLIGWEYSTNDDFQDVVCRVDNADLITAP